MNKKAFELSISVIVTIIISIVLLSMGIFLLSKFVGQAQDIKSELDVETDQQLSLLLESGEKVAIPFNSFTLRRGDSQIVGLGILNIDEKQDFSVEVVLSNAFEPEPGNTQIPSVDMAGWVKYNRDFIELDKNDNTKTVLLFTVPEDALSGTYIFNVKVLDGLFTEYGLKKVYITVP